MGKYDKLSCRKLKVRTAHSYPSVDLGPIRTGRVVPRPSRFFQSEGIKSEGIRAPSAVPIPMPSPIKRARVEVERWHGGGVGTALCALIPLD